MAFCSVNMRHCEWKQLGVANGFLKCGSATMLRKAYRKCYASEVANLNV